MQADEKRTTRPEDTAESGSAIARPTTTKWEIWAWYSYYVGNNGLGPFNFGPTAFQNLLSQASYDFRFPAGSMMCDTSSPDTCGLHFAGRDRTINSIVLISNGISFAIQAAIFVIFGTFADYSSAKGPNWRRWILIVLSVIAFAVGFAWLGVHTPDKWQAATALYILGLFTYQGCITFWTAAFPGLARDTPEVQEAEHQLATGEITNDDYLRVDMLQRNRLSNVSFYVQSVVEIVILAVILGILKAMHSDDSIEQNTYSNAVLVAFSTAIWLVVAVPWFILEKNRPGEIVPPGQSVVSYGLSQLGHTFLEVIKLKQTALYMVGYFLLGDALNTNVTVIATLQNEVVAYSSFTLALLLIVGIAAQAIGIGAFWYVQRRFAIPTKSMFLFNAFGIVLLSAWGCIGIGSSNFGFKAEYTFYLYQVFYGIWVCPWYAYSQTMISEVTPPGKEFLFFALFGVIGKTSSFIGPFVSSAIIDRSGNLNEPFIFLLALSVVSFIIIACVDVKKSKIECSRYIAAWEKNPTMKNCK